MSKKQLQHLEKARRIKANKHKDLNTSEGVLNTINTIINNMDLTSQAKGNSASNTINALINYQRLLKDHERETGNGDKIDAIKVYYIDPNTPLSVLRIALLETDVKAKMNGEKVKLDNKGIEALTIIRNRVKAYNEILNYFSNDNDLLANIDDIEKAIQHYESVDNCNISLKD